jgi:formylmethanofuran dehydrogenase subunit C
MSTTTLSARDKPSFRVDGSALSPAALASLTPQQITHLALPSGNGTIALGELFDVSCTDATATATADADADAGPSLVIDADAGWLDRLGAQMSEGTLRVSGAAGDYAGWRMSGGTLEIDGDTGDFAACEMSAGRVTVRGNAGQFVAGALPGGMEGMTGGTVTILGNTGARLADRMRRGLVLVGGDTAEFAASRLVAGTVGVAGRVGAHYAYGMRRGTLILLQAPEQPPPTFTDGGNGFSVFWTLLTRSFAHELAPFAALAGGAGSALPTRLSGDLAVDGRGEILIV